MGEERMGEKEIALLFFPVPVVGHLKSTVELAMRLLESNPSFSITVFLMHLEIPSVKYATNTASYVQSVASTHPTIRFLHLPRLHHQFQPNQDKLSSFSEFIEKHKPHVKEAIKQLRFSPNPNTCISALFFDMFSSTMIEVGKDLGIPTYIYFTSGANSLALMLYLPTLDLSIPCEFRDWTGDVEVPGLMPMPPAMLPDPMAQKKSSGYAWFVTHGRRLRHCDGIIVNTFQEMDPKAHQAINEGRCLPDHPTMPPVYPVGPLLATDKNSQDSEMGKVMEWLDHQPPSSVAYLCFGSMGSFPAPQLKEMAKGLEQSGKHFLWALRCSDANEIEMILPEGFLDRIQDRGLVWQFWVPQTAVLEHEAVGGFISHCGWNSILESIWFGKPILAWPLHAEQKMYAFHLIHDYGIALELGRKKDDGWVSAEELEKGVACLMGESEQGKKVKQRMKEMSAASRRAVEEGGSSFSSLELLLKKLIQ